MKKGISILLKVVPMGLLLVFCQNAYGQGFNSIGPHGMPGMLQKPVSFSVSIGKKGVKVSSKTAFQPNIPMAGVSEPPKMGTMVHEVWLKKIDNVRLAPPPPTNMSPQATPVKIPGVGIVRGNVLVSAHGNVLSPEGVSLPEPTHVSLPVNGTPTPTLHSLEQGIKVETNDVPPVEEGQ